MSPEQLIQTAWVNRAREDIEDRHAQGLKARQTTWPVWAPEVAVQALRDAGWTPPACGCGPTEDEKAFAETGGVLAAMPLDEFNQLCEELYESGEGPEVGR